MKLTMLGTGNALVTECYNTCFVLEAQDGQRLLVDGGGGNGLLRQLKAAGIDWRSPRQIFLTHRHLDHLTGILWMMRMICQNLARGAYEGDAWIYGHDEVTPLLRELADRLLLPKERGFLDTRLHLVTVTDGETRELIGRPVTFFDLGSVKTKQYGFCMEYEPGRRLVCPGDEPLPERAFPMARGCDWLFHEAFCLYSEAEVFRPYEKNHTTVREACETAERLGVRNLLLYHTEEKNLARRRELYTAEGSPFYHGALLVPDDLDVIEL